MKEINCACPICQEEITLEVLNDFKVHQECSNCNVLLEIENEIVNRSTYKVESSQTVEEILQRIEEIKNELIEKNSKETILKIKT